MTLDYDKLLADLRHESDGLAELLTTLTYEQWGWPTPARGWGIQDQVSHLAFFDDSTVLALTDPGEFRTQADKLMADGMDFPDRIAKNHRILTPETLLDWFVEARRRLLAAIAVDDPKRRIPWFGPEMSIASSATARLMETWAHSQDIYDTLGIAHPPSPGLRSIAHLGV
ncbi:maleylpyruvate isomerase family mycothiol-dependent enzyme, partial [Mycobacterium sp.]|uniref:maleylpyruvate isomerase family mycothiol-dependent enzyme n=1 Tax=Mycobacterium sp. TaxID=1785 RepID=UPI002CD2F001